VTNPHHTPSPSPGPDSPPVGWWDRAAIIALGGAGCALSYDALQQMAVAIHVRPQLSYLFPLVIDGFIAYGIRALLVMSTAPLRARLYTWTLFATATTASIWANALHAVRLNQQTNNGSLRLGDHVVAVLSTIAPLALAGAVHLYILITRHHPSRDAKKDQPGPARQTTLVAVRADPDDIIRTGPHNPLQRADHTHDHAHDLQAQRTTDRGPDQLCGRQRGPADHSEPGQPERTSGPEPRVDQNTADQPPPGQEPADQPGGDHSGPDDHGQSERGTSTAGPASAFEAADQHLDPADPSWDHAEPPASGPQTAPEPATDTAPEAAEDSAGQTVSHQPTPGQGDDTSPLEPVFTALSTEFADRAEVRADQAGEADQDRGPADRTGTASGDQPPHGTSGPDHPADHDRGPDVGTSGPDRGASHEPADHPSVSARGPAPKRQAGPEPETGANQRPPRTADRTGTGRAGGAPAADNAAGLEELLSIAREAALAEGRMTRRALRPYLNEAGVPISNERFTELQQYLYADPKLAHLPRPGRRPR
jgi:hypothetical protein